jgi:hypothetical protein
MITPVGWRRSTEARGDERTLGGRVASGLCDLPGRVRPGCHSSIVARDDKEFELSITLGRASFTAAGEARLVMEALEKFSALVEAPEPAGGEEEGGEEGEGAPAAPVKRASKGEKQPLPVFLDGRKLKNNQEFAAAIVAWAQKYNGKASGIKPADIATYWRGTKQKEPGNLRRDLGDAVKAGLLHREGGFYTVTGFGKTTIGLAD